MFGKESVYLFHGDVNKVCNHEDTGQSKANAGQMGLEETLTLDGMFKICSYQPLRLPYF